jgi:peptide/nickel transport system ATP-binding protein
MTDPPIRSIDIPDPVNPPSGCRFHTRCPEARAACTTDAPDLGNAAAAPTDRHTACHRADPDHEYWDSEPLEGVETTESPMVND